MKYFNWIREEIRKVVEVVYVEVSKKIGSKEYVKVSVYV